MNRMNETILSYISRRVARSGIPEESKRVVGLVAESSQRPSVRFSDIALAPKERVQ